MCVCFFLSIIKQLVDDWLIKVEFLIHCMCTCVVNSAVLPEIIEISF